MPELRTDPLENGVTRMDCIAGVCDKLYRYNRADGEAWQSQNDSSILNENGVVLGNQIEFIYIYKGHRGKVPKTPSKITNRRGFRINNQDHGGGGSPNTPEITNGVVFREPNQNDIHL